MLRRRPSPTNQAAPERARDLPAAPASPLALPPVDIHRSLATTVFHTLPGRLLVVSLVIKGIVAVAQRVGVLSAVVQVLDGAASIGLLVALVYFTSRLVVGVKRRLLWRVRRKLILSYVFIGFVPTLLILAFFLFGLRLMFTNVSAYMFKDGFDDLVAEVATMARETALEIAITSRRPQVVIDQRLAEHRDRYADLSIALTPVPTAAGSLNPGLSAGPWWHLDPPPAVPAWVPSEGFAGTLAFVPSDAPGQPELVIRAVAFPQSPPAGYAVVVDLPVTGQVIEHLYDVTGIRAGALSIQPETEGAARPMTGPARTGASVGAPHEAPEPVSLFNFERSVAFLDYVDWQSGIASNAYVSLTVRLGELYERISAVQGILRGNMSVGQFFLLVLFVVAGLFLVIEVVALVMGFALARSITSSVHELFMGTERVRQGDFTHRIRVKSRDQLGELAESFNQMTGSIEDLLQQAAEKKRLEEELRIAREIQMSLLPDGPLQMPGLAMTALCVPAREVGGDYYDFFPLDDRHVGVLIADVAGKGTSAALYMAELKGLVLSLSQTSRSPRQLLIEANRILADNLDSRAFITMTYAMVDMEAGAMTYARAGHTPLIYLPARRGIVEVLTPNGMVVGLRLPGAEEKFAELLEEQRIPLEPGDVFVFYTDGISEAMNPQDDLFGEARLSRIVEEHGHLESAELRERILREIQAFAAGADQHDDMTMILLKIGAEAAAGPRPATTLAAAGVHAGADGAQA